MCNDEFNIKMLIYSGTDNYLTYFVKVSFNIMLILSICATLVLSCLLLLSSMRITIFCLSISFMLAKNHRQHYFANSDTEQKNQKTKIIARKVCFSFQLGFAHYMKYYFTYLLSFSWLPQFLSSYRFLILLQIGDHYNSLDYVHPFSLLEKKSLLRDTIIFLKRRHFLLNDLKLYAIGQVARRNSSRNSRKINSNK